jgi:hypothetical protein
MGSDSLNMGLESVTLGIKPFGKCLRVRWRRKWGGNIKMGLRKMVLRMRYGRTGSEPCPVANLNSW